MQLFSHGRKSGKRALPDGQYAKDWSSAQELEAPAEEKENALSRLLMKGLSAISNAWKMLLLVPYLFPSSQETAIRCLSPVRRYLNQ